MTLRYAAYRDSGHGWLREVPASWGVSRIKNLFEIKKRIVGELGHDVLSVTQNGLRVRDTESNDGQVSMDYSKYQIVEPGDFVMNHMDLLTGYVDISAFTGVTSPDYRVFSARGSDLSSRYFLYLFQNGYRRRIFYAFGQGASEFGRWRMPTDSFNDFGIPVPPLAEQQAIAAFLDRETAKIDMLMAEQRRLIHLLREKRQAVISHAVTRGLDPDVPLKPSGVDWLGDVPEGWEVSPLKHLVTHVVDCLHTTPTYDGELRYPAIRTADVHRGVLLLEQARLVSKDIYLERIQRLKPQAGDILYSREGERLGMAALVPKDVELCLGQRMMMFRPTKEVCSSFLMWVMNSEPIYQQVMEKNIGSTSPHANIGDVINFIVPRPALTEQRLIAAFLDTAACKFDALTVTAESAITLLQERRAALISAAVTGKIDVRGVVREEEEAA